MNRFIQRLAIALVLAMLAGGCASPPVEIRVMSFNIEWGGAHVSFDNVVAAIRQADADVVGVQEAQGNLERLALALGWHYDRRNHVVSRFPLLDPEGGDGRFLLVEVRPGEVVVLANLHLPSDPYGPDLVRDGASVDAVIANERATRLPVLHAFLDRLPAWQRAGYPVFVTGDFNAPAHTDWTDAMVGRRAFLDYAVAWPVSLAMEKAGFSDGWRAVYPDPRSHPGLTWWAGRPPLEAYAPGSEDPEDRIDQVWYSGPAEAHDAFLVGERGAPEVRVGVMPWPSDHRAVVVTFDVQPKPLPGLLTTRQHVDDIGAPVRLVANFPGRERVRIDIEEVVNGRGVQQLSWRHDRPLAAVHLPAGGYRAVATTEARRYERLFWVVAADAEPRIALQGDEFGVNQPLPVAWQDAPGNRFDYLGVYAAGTDDPVGGLLAYAYTDALPNGQLDLRAATPTAAGLWPRPGRFIVRLMKDDGYEVLAESSVFEIR